jgi:XTP/dITP diphosphohydrolase
MKLVFATQNWHKLREIQAMMPKGIELISLTDLKYHEDIAETGATLRENALIKARFIYEKFGLNCFADDSGLEVEALDGAPGVYSARYAGEEQIAGNNIKKLLHEMEGKDNRLAAFKTVIALVLNDQDHFFEGSIEGEITYSEMGESGFGYDPVFKPLGYEHTFAQMSHDEKNTISHRARAVNKLVDFLKELGTD